VAAATPMTGSATSAHPKRLVFPVRCCDPAQARSLLLQALDARLRARSRHRLGRRRPAPRSSSRCLGRCARDGRRAQDPHRPDALRCSPGPRRPLCVAHGLCPPRLRAGTRAHLARVRCTRAMLRHRARGRHAVTGARRLRLRSRGRDARVRRPQHRSPGHAHAAIWFV